MAEEFAIIKLNVEHNKLTVAKACLLTSDSIGYIKAQFNTKTEDWDSVVKIATFKMDGNLCVELLDADNSCFIPAQSLAEEGILFVGLYGVADGRRITTNNVMLKVFEGSYDEDIKDADLEEQFFEIVMKELNNKVDKTTTVAGIPLDNDITRDELLEALDIQGGGSGGDGGPVSWEDVIDRPTSLSQFEDDLGDTPIHTHHQYAIKQDVVDKKYIDTALKNKANLYHTHDEYITEETDPNVPDWAKQPSKPSYSYDEIEGTPPATDLTGYATEDFVRDQIAEIPIPEGYTAPFVIFKPDGITDENNKTYATLAECCEALKDCNQSLQQTIYLDCEFIPSGQNVTIPAGEYVLPQRTVIERLELKQASFQNISIINGVSFKNLTHLTLRNCNLNSNRNDGNATIVVDGCQFKLTLDNASLYSQSRNKCFIELKNGGQFNSDLKNGTLYNNGSPVLYLDEQSAANGLFFMVHAGSSLSKNIVSTEGVMPETYYVFVYPGAQIDELNQGTVLLMGKGNTVGYDGTESGLIATNVQDAIDELNINSVTKEYVDQAIEDAQLGMDPDLELILSGGGA